MVMQSVKSMEEKIVIILGKTEQVKNIATENNLTIISSSNTSEINKYVLESEIIISRSGYSTIMDLQKLQSKAIFVPTPGQTQQEYLAKYLKKRGVCFYQKQNEFDLNKAINKSLNYSGFNSKTMKEKLTVWDNVFY